MLQLFSFLAIFYISLSNCDPQILRLKSIPSPIPNVEEGAKLYLASNDDNGLLKNIQVQTAGGSFTLDQINVNTANGNAKSIVIDGGLVISTSNSNADTSGLTGFLYLTTKKQADDPAFSVYVIKQAQTVSTTQPNSTVVILNTELDNDALVFDQPFKSSYVTNINQSPGSNLFFHWGFPSFNWNQTQITNQFFENPRILEMFDPDLKTINYTRLFFDHIEPLQIGLDYWYFTASEPMSMTMESKYVSDLVYTTTSVNTTGLVVNDFLFQEHVVKFQLDLTRVRTIGTLVSAIPIASQINVIFNQGGGISAQSYATNTIHAQSFTYMQPETLTINATSLLPGFFTCQYFGVTGDLLPPGTSTPSTTVAPTTSVVTTPVSSYNYKRSFLYSYN
ncbi:CUB_2 domain-containing protein [Caenorhabditis elegans]|uniref:CUB_2 domain-containing protein n=1 Tax=Caenorhabditis elegans TaxID=6239 RepID=Q9N4X1_CAEEL|nr:CUB_2 domain-containing protein [Caenorhabditis elegans]CCD69508.2 CUB_2 domain-containing protein [Caenorhabditis elegans]|eukprot:NP_494505.4 Uncharacterized protein CELE_Y46D2A.2 [Caenorhabditis elegans]